MFPEELNKFLQGEIRALTQENGILRRSLEERESDLQVYIDQQQTFSSSLPALVGSSRSSELATSKIVELSKRVRELTAELEGHRSRHRAAKAKLERRDAAHHSNQTREPSHGDGDKDYQVKILTGKLNAANTKLCECHNKCQQLRQDLKVAQEALSSEIGDDISIQALTSGNSNWRGRAQQILTLQQKVSELQKRLGEQSKSSTDKTGPQSRAVAVVRQIEKERRAAHEQTERDLKYTTAQLEECKTKLDAARARGKVLEGEMTTLKERLSTISGKGSHDDQRIAALTCQLSSLEKKTKDQEAVQQATAVKFEKKCQCLLQELTREKSRVAEIQALLSERDSKISKLEERMMENRENMVQHMSHRLSRSSSQDSVGSSRSAVQLTEATKSSEALGMAAEAERVRLLELLAVTNRRLNEQQKMTEKAEDCLRCERQKSVHLETKLARLELDIFGSKKSGNYRGAKFVEKGIPIPDYMKDKLELLQEEVYVLQTRLQSVKEEKEEDLKCYKSLLEQTRRIFLEAQRRNNQETSAQSQGSTSSIQRKQLL